MQFNKEQIYKALDLLNISTNNHINGSWLSIKCPMHKEETPYGSCSVDLDTGGIHCFSCKGDSSIIKLIAIKFNFNDLDYKDSFKKVLQLLNIHSYSKGTTTERVQSKKPNRSNVPKSIITHDFEEINFPPENYYYTKQREFTKEFCKEFNITRALSGIYNDYMIIPIKDSEKKIEEFEARRLMEVEYLHKLFNVLKGDPNRLRKNFKQYIKTNNIRMENYVVLQNGEIVDSSILKYLLQPKVKYVSNSQVYRTLWNIDNLKYDEELYLTEGIGSMPKIWTHITKNCTCTFGSEIDEDQIKNLKKFLKIIVIPDNDVAGRLMIKKLHLHLTNFTIKNIKVDDTNEGYIEEIKNAKEINPSRFVSKMLFFKNKKGEK